MAAQQQGQVTQLHYGNFASAGVERTRELRNTVEALFYQLNSGFSLIRQVERENEENSDGVNVKQREEKKGDEDAQERRKKHVKRLLGIVNQKLKDVFDTFESAFSKLESLSSEGVSQLRSRPLQSQSMERLYWEALQDQCSNERFSALSNSVYQAEKTFESLRMGQYFFAHHPQIRRNRHRSGTQISERTGDRLAWNAAADFESNMVLLESIYKDPITSLLSIKVVQSSGAYDTFPLVLFKNGLYFKFFHKFSVSVHCGKVPRGGAVPQQHMPAVLLKAVLLIRYTADTETNDRLIIIEHVTIKGADEPTEPESGESLITDDYLMEELWTSSRHEVFRRLDRYLNGQVLRQSSQLITSSDHLRFFKHFLAVLSRYRNLFSEQCRQCKKVLHHTTHLPPICFGPDNKFVHDTCR